MQWLLYRKEDLVLVAKASFVHSLMWQILPCLVPRTIVIAILLGAEKASSIQKYLAANAGARPIVVNAKNISKTVLHDIRIGYYIHTLVSPELPTGKKFRHSLHISVVWLNG
jgi:hypothetical protein